MSINTKTLYKPYYCGECKRLCDGKYEDFEIGPY